MEMGHLELFCSDVLEAKKFYTNVLSFELVQESPDLVWVKLGNREILLRTGQDTNDVNYQQTNTGLVLYTENLTHSRKLLEERGLEFLGIDGSEKCLTFKDPFGHWWQLVNPHDH